MKLYMAKAIASGKPIYRYNPTTEEFRRVYYTNTWEARRIIDADSPPIFLEFTKEG